MSFDRRWDTGPARVVSQLHAQPIVEINAVSVPRFELLLRMRENDGRLLVPGAFLYNAERFGLIGSIDRWVLGRPVPLLEQLPALV